jgi:hypothetical protein
MDSDSERFHRCADLIGDGRVQFPGADCRKEGVFGEGAVHVNAENFHILADMLKACVTLITVTAGDMGFGSHPVSFFKVRHILSDLNDLSGIFMPEKERELDSRCGEFIPLVDMNVGTADGCMLHPDQ